MSNGKGKGNAGKNGSQRKKAIGDGGAPWLKGAEQKDNWSCGCGGYNAHRNYTWRDKCIACDAPRPKKVVRHTTETVPNIPRDRPWSGEARLRQSEKQVQELRMELNTLRRKEAHDIPVGDDKDIGMDDAAETVEGPNDDLQRLRAKKRDMHRTLMAVKKMHTTVCGDYVAAQVRDLEANIQSLYVEIEESQPAHQKVVALTAP